jgi:hypothetical protein
MTKQIAWNIFKETGDINAYLEFIELRNLEENNEGNINETSKSKWNSYI